MVGDVAYWTVEAVADGATALRVAQDAPPDLIVSDVMMLGLDGFELLQAVRSDARMRGLPVILLSARAGEDAAVEALEAGADAYLVKPFSARELIAYVAGHLQLRRLRREAQAAVAASDAKFSAAFNQSPLAVTITTLGDGRLVEVNDGFERISGYTRDEAIGRTVNELELWIEPQRRAEGLERLRAGERIAESEIRLRTKTGEARVGIVGSVVIELNGRPHVLSSVVDVTERKRADEALRQRSAELAALNAALKEADRRKDEFLAMLGHELRNPLSALRSAVATASLAPLHRTRALEIARRQTDQLGRLIDDLLDVARLTQGRISLHKERVSLAEIIGRAVENTQPFIESRGVGLDLSLAALPMRVDADPARLEQVFVNLLTNAGKYTDVGGRITIASECHGETGVIRIRDTGIGIAPEMLSRIWDLFAQADRSLDRAQGGLGIGLTVARRLVELHGGMIEAHSDGPGLGAEFVVFLPLASGTSDEVAIPAETATARRGVRVLLVEDNVDAAESLMMLLELLGHRVRVAHDGLAALDAARALVPDVMLVDIGLPGMDGYEVAQQVRRDPIFGTVVLVALTGYGRDDDKKRAIGAGFDYHLVKPVTPEVLSGVVAQIRTDDASGPTTVH